MAHDPLADPQLVARLSERLAAEAEGALGGLTDQVRAVLESARDMPDLLHRLDKLELDPEAFTVALQRGLAIAHLAGQAALMDEIGKS